MQVNVELYRAHALFFLQCAAREDVQIYDGRYMQHVPFQAIKFSDIGSAFYSF